MQTITELVTRLFEQVDSHAKGYTATIIIPKSKLDAVMKEEKRNKNAYMAPTVDYDDVYEDEIDGTEVTQQSSLERIKAAVIIGVLLLAILMVIATILLNVFNGEGTEKIKSGVDSFSSLDNVVTVTSATEDITTEETEITTTIKTDSLMPNLIGKSFEIQKSAHAGWITLDPIYEYNNDYESGLIYDQEIKEGENFASGSTVKVWVSKGSENVSIPSFSNLKIDDYLQKLAALGIRYEQKPEENYNYQNGYVTRTSKEPGSTINVKNGDILVVYYAENPEITTVITNESAKNTESDGQGDSVIVVD